MTEDEGMLQTFRQLSSPEWIFGKSSAEKAALSRDFGFGVFDVALRGDGAQVNTDCLRTDLVEKLESCINQITKAPMAEGHLEKTFVEALSTPEEREMAETLFNWIVPAIKKVTGI
jgi:hypothetical protein